MGSEDFKKELQLNYKSEKTIKSYCEQIDPFLRHCNGEVTQEKVDNYIRDRRANVSKSTCNLFINALRKYCEFSNIDIKIPKQETPKKDNTKPYWSVKEFEEEVLHEIYGDEDVILRTMFFTGLRPHELWNLKAENIDFKQETFIIHGKGDKKRVIPFLDNKLTEKLKGYVKEGEYVFDINKRKLKYLFDKIKENLSLDYDVTPYIMRRSFACYCEDIGMSLKQIKQIMGHTNIKTTDGYLSENPKRLIEACKKLRRN